MRIKTPQLICFDIGGVLVRLNPSFSRKLLSRAESNEVRNLEQLLRDDFTHGQTEYSASERYQLGQMTSDEYVDLLVSGLGGRIINDEIRAALMAEIAGDVPETAKILEPLAKITRLGCFSNTNAIHWDYLNARFPWMARFEVALASHLVGFAKPAPEAFESICAAAQLAPQDCLFIDDRLVNVEGAQNFGMKALLFKTPQSLLQDLRQCGITIEPERDFNR